MKTCNRVEIAWCFGVSQVAHFNTIWELVILINKMANSRIRGLYSLVAQRIKCLPAMRESQVRSLGWENPLEKEMATHSSILAWRIPWTEEPDTTERLHFQMIFLVAFSQNGRSSKC